MSENYGTYPNAAFTWNNSNLSYVYISYYGNTTATSSTITSPKMTGTSYTSADLSLNTLYTFTMTPYNTSGASGVAKTIVIDTTPKVSGIYSTNTTASNTQLQWYGTYDYVKVSRATGIGSSGALGSYSDISTNVYSMPYYDKDLSGNTNYSYYITPYSGTTALTASNKISVYTNVQAAKDLSYTFLDSSAVTISFTTPKNSYTSSVSYTLSVYNLTLGYVQSATGTTSPLFVQNLSSGTDHKCYIITKLDNDTSLISTSDSKTITTSYTGSTYYYYSISSITGGTWGTSDEAFASSYSGQYMYGVASSSNYFNYSSDYGANWTAYQINTSFYTKGICCSWDGSIVFVVGTQGSSYGTLYKSTDYGVSFTQITSANFSSTTDYFWDVACSSDGKYVYICSKTTTGYYYSSDYGVSWTKLTNIASNNIKCSPDGKYVVCSSSSSTVYAKLSSDYGLTWSNLSIYTGYSNCAISQNGTYILLYNTTAGYWTLSTNGGTSFTSITTLYYAGASNPRDGCSMSYTGQYMFITYSNGTYLSGLAYSMDYGSTWQFVMYSKPYCSNSLALGNHTKPICVAPSGNYAVGRYNGNNTTFVLNLTSTTVMKSTSFYDIIPTTNLLFLYKFATTDVSGTTSLANYATGTAVYDATLSNSLAVGSTSSYIKYGTGYLAPNYYVTLKSFTTAYANGWCLSEWVLYTATPYGSLFHYYTAAGSGGNPDLTMYYSTTKTLQVYSLPASDWLGNGAYMKTVDDGTYHHIVINSIYVSSSLNIIQHFYDGTLIMEYYDTNTTNTSNVTPVYNYINTRGGSQVHNGYTSCFRFYQRNLSLSEILKLYCSGM